MKIKLIISFIILTLSTAAMAGVKEKKAKRALIEETDKKLLKTQKSCSNSKVKVAFDFKKYSAYMDTNAEALKTKHFAYTYAGRATSLMLSNLSTLCKDQDYKEEIGKLETIKVYPQVKYSDRNASFKISSDGKTLTAQLSANPSTPSGYSKLLKAAW